MHQDWNDVKDSDEDEDSWDDDQKPFVNEVKKQTQQTPQTQKTHENEVQKQKQKPKFLKDEQILQKIKNKTIEQRKKLKIVNCVNEDVQAIIKNHKLISYLRQVRNGLYIACFKTEQDTITFIEQKIQKKYRFFIHQYIKTEKDIQKQKQREQKMLEKQKQREKGYHNSSRDNQKGKTYKPKHQTEQQHQNKRNRQKKQLVKQNRNRPQYNQEQEQPKQVNKNKNNKHKEDHYEKISEKKIQLNFEIKQNHIRIKSNQYNKMQIVDTIEYLKMLKEYKALRIIIPNKQCLQKALKLCQLIQERLNWGLQKLPSQKEREKQNIQLVLKEGSKIKIEQSQFKTLKANSKRYFQDIQKKNKYKISADFNLDEYLKGFKDNQKIIFKNYNKWVLKAQGDDIPKLLKLSWMLKKDQFNNVEIKVGTIEEMPFATLQITQGEHKQKRPKVDASIVNSILTN